MKKDFRIFALVVVKNEEDIITDTIEAAALWADKIFIIDNNSEDSTWEKLKDLRDKHHNVILWGQYGGKFNEGLRQILYREYRNNSQPNDWWCRLDGDEFYIDDPREFLERLPDTVDHVYNASFQYYLTEKDFSLTGKTENDRKINYKNLDWYKCNHSEIRFVKNKPGLCWSQDEGWPCNLYKATSLRIRLKHYQYRSLEQIRMRLLVRSVKLSGDTFKHEIVTEDEWYIRRGFKIPLESSFRENRVVNSEELENSQEFIIRYDSLPPIIKSNAKKRLKCILVAFYMKYLNNYLFKI